MSCGFVAFRKEENRILYLLLQYEGGYWDFSRGHIDEGENETEAAFRELLEETGISSINMIKGFREMVEYSYMWRNKKVYKEVVLFLGKTDDIDIKMSHEHIGFEWLEFDDALNRLTYDNSKRVLKKADEFLKRKKIWDFINP